MTKKELTLRIDFLEKELKEKFLQVEERLNLLAEKFKCEFKVEEYIAPKNYYRMFYFGEQEKEIKKRYVLKPIINKKKK